MNADVYLQSVEIKSEMIVVISIKEIKRNIREFNQLFPSRDGDLEKIFTDFILESLGLNDIQFDYDSKTLVKFEDYAHCLDFLPSLRNRYQDFIRNLKNNGITVYLSIGA